MLRLKELRQQNGVTLKALGDEIGCAESTVSLYEAGRREPSRDILIKIADYFGVTLDYLLGRDDTYPDLSSEALSLARDYDRMDEISKKAIRGLAAVENERAAAAEPETEPVYIRHYLTPAAAGYASPIEGEDYEMIPVDDSVPKGADFCIDVSGDSMEPYIKDGSRVYVRRGDVEEISDAGVFFVDGDVYVKQWCVDMIGTLHLLSANPRREDANIQIPRDSGRNVVCFGRVMLGKKLPAPSYK